MRKLYQHYHKNQFWFWTGMETYALGIVFIIQANFFDLMPPAHSVVAGLDDPLSIFCLAIVGTFAVVYSIWDFHWFYARPILIAMLVFVWVTFFCGFLIHDIELGAIVSPGAVLTGGVIFRITSYAFTGDD